MFSGVTIKAKASTEVEFTGGKFVGTYSPFEITEANKNEIVYLGSNNAIGYYSGTTFPKTLHAFRAHFYLPTTSSARAMNRAIINFGDGTTGIVKMEDVDDAWYCLDGRRLSGQPSAKGIYIHNGRKEVLK